MVRKIKRLRLEKKSNVKEILKFAGTGSVDEEAVKELRIGWKKWSERYS